MTVIMFEARNICAAHRAEFTGGGLRRPGWDELVARLGAARDLRHALAGPNRMRGGSFARFAMGQVAAPECAVNAKQDGVNQPGLVDGKGTVGIVLPATEQAAMTDRDTQ